jgi:ABC-2 type transport system permease protein
MRSLFKLVWLEIKIFVREPMGVVGTVVVPVLVFVAFGRLFGGRLAAAGSAGAASFVSVSFPVFIALLIALNAVLSLVTIVSIYREGGILKRLRSTPLSPVTILGGHVIVKLLFTALTLALMMLAGRRYYPVGIDAPLGSFLLALLVTTLSILSIGFLISSIVPTARFAQPLGGLILYPMVGLSGLFYPVEALPPGLAIVARVLPLTYAVSLLEGIWTGESWLTHAGDVAVLALVFAACTALSAKVFRWE